MRRNAVTALYALAVGYALAHFLVAFYNHWYFAGYFWLKVGLVTPLVAAAFSLALLTTWGWLWRAIGWWWIITHLLAMIPAGGPDLMNMAFVAVLDFEVAVVWVPLFALLLNAGWREAQTRRLVTAEQRRTTAELKLRRKLRQRAARNGPVRSVTVSPGEANHAD